MFSENRYNGITVFNFRGVPEGIERGTKIWYLGVHRKIILIQTRLSNCMCTSVKNCFYKLILGINFLIYARFIYLEVLKVFALLLFINHILWIFLAKFQTATNLKLYSYNFREKLPSIPLFLHYRKVLQYKITRVINEIIVR